MFSVRPYGLSIAYQAPLSAEFSRQAYWSGLPCPPPGRLPDPGIEPASLVSSALAGRFLTTSSTWEGQAVKEDLIQDCSNRGERLLQ